MCRVFCMKMSTWGGFTTSCPETVGRSRMGHPNVPRMYTYTGSHRDRRRSSRLQPYTPNGEWNRITTDVLQCLSVDVGSWFWLWLIPSFTYRTCSLCFSNAHASKSHMGPPCARLKYCRPLSSLMRQGLTVSFESTSVVVIDGGKKLFIHSSFSHFQRVSDLWFFSQEFLKGRASVIFHFFNKKIICTLNVLFNILKCIFDSFWCTTPWSHYFPFISVPADPGLFVWVV